MKIRFVLGTILIISGFSFFQDLIGMDGVKDIQYPHIIGSVMLLLGLIIFPPSGKIIFNKLGVQDDTKLIAIILAFFFGILGIHKFYLGETKKGILYLLLMFFGISFFLAMYDVYKIYNTPIEKL